MDYNSLTSVAKPVARLIQELHRLPGVGPKTAQRLTYYLVRIPQEESKALAEAILAVKEQLVFCSICQNITESDPCLICGNSSRDHTRVCVVEEPLDVLSLESTGHYKGLYHVLHGVISPMHSIGPDDLRIRELLARLHAGSIEEMIIATNPNVEGEATAMYIHRIAVPLVRLVTRLARGLPVGGDLEYADQLTLTRALDDRQEF